MTTMTKPATVTLDARTIPTAQRSSYILEAFDRLPIGGVLELSEESDPRALRNEFAQYRPGSSRGTRATSAPAIGRFASSASTNAPTSRRSSRTARRSAPRKPKRFASSRPSRPNAATSTARRSSTKARSGRILASCASGKVVLTLLSADGKTQALGERLVFDPLNETGVFDGGGATTRAEALTDCDAGLVPSEAVQSAVRTDTELALGFLAAASQARRRSIDTIADLAFAHVLQRVAKFLLSYAPDTAGMASGLPGVENLSQAQIAAAAGTVRDMAARALLRLKNAKAVELDRGRVRALDRDRLSAFAHNVQAPPV